jgi:hypothetical protein
MSRHHQRVLAPLLPLLLLPLLLLAVSGDAAAQDIRGRVVDDASRQGVGRVEVTLVDTAGGQIAQSVTGADGFFTLRAPAAGDYRLVVVHPGFTREERAVRVATAALTVPAFVLKTQAVVLDALTAEGQRSASAAAEATFSRSSFVVAGSRLARLEQVNASPTAVMRDFAGVRVREWQDRSGKRILCIESTRHLPSLMNAQQNNPACDWITIVLDGVTIQDPETTFRTLSIHQFESIEYVPPGDGGYRYGLQAGGTGAIVLWTRGRGPHVSDERNRRPPN